MRAKVFCLAVALGLFAGPLFAAVTVPNSTLSVAAVLSKTKASSPICS